MTKEQIQMLRELIQAEITYATADWGKNGRYREFYSDTTKKWEQFTETFNSTPTEPFEIDV